MTRRTGWTTSALLRAPLPKADLATLRVFVEWRRRGVLYGVGIRELAKRSGHSEGRVRRVLTGGPVASRALVVADLAGALGL